MGAVLAVLALVGATSPAYAQSSWSSCCISGVQASGTYSTSGGVTVMSGRVYDTGGDGKYVFLYVRFSTECCAHKIDNNNGVNTSVGFTLTTTSPHAEINECKKSTFTVATCGGWKRIF
ncbi:hypothetical protein ASD06_01185 [Angustibacter sp. Root456]|nr:hypothetical protein ASD06_01185 [Angustibacter sp. Root456]